MKKTSNILIRVDEIEKSGFERAATISGLGLSSWARQVLRNAAIKQLHEVGEKAEFLEPAPKKIENPKSNKKASATFHKIIGASVKSKK